MSNKYEISRSGSLRNVSFAVVDCETTGVNPETDRILQVAAIIVNGEGEVVDQFDTVVRPESPENYTHGAEHIHGISKEQVENGMPLREALEKLWTISSGNVFTAHNARLHARPMQRKLVDTRWTLSASTTASNAKKPTTPKPTQQRLLNYSFIS
jgi:DNA polymerase III epsilon subunit-like protein